MKKSNIIRAAEFYLCDDDLELAVQKLEEGRDDVIIWQPFENYTPEEVYDLILKLAEAFDEVENEVRLTN